VLAAGVVAAAAAVASVASVAVVGAPTGTAATATASATLTGLAGFGVALGLLLRAAPGLGLVGLRSLVALGRSVRRPLGLRGAVGRRGGVTVRTGLNLLLGPGLFVGALLRRPGVRPGWLALGVERQGRLGGLRLAAAGLLGLALPFADGGDQVPLAHARGVADAEFGGESTKIGDDHAGQPTRTPLRRRCCTACLRLPVTRRACLGVRVAAQKIGVAHTCPS